MTRAEHLQWAKDRALQYVEQRDHSAALASLVSDLGKHEELQKSEAIAKDLGLRLLMAGLLNQPDEMKKFITGFN